jgi:hypothetical protein
VSGGGDIDRLSDARNEDRCFRTAAGLGCSIDAMTFASE